jgi:hypothetical protein
MTTRLASVLLVTSIIGCGSSNNNTPVDAAPMVPAHIMIMGTTKSAGLGSNPLAGVAVAAYQNTDENTVIAMATSDQSGNFTLDITTNGKPLDGFIKASISGYLDTYLYAPATITADYNGAAMNLVTESTLETLSGNSFCAHPISNTMPVGVVGLEAVDNTGAVVAGASFVGTPAPATYCYNGSSGFPDHTATVTAADGLGYMIDVSGDVAVTATKAGSTFGTHHIKVRPGTLTTTLAQAQ